MADKADFQETFLKLKAILEPYVPQLKVVSDKPGNYYLDTHHIMKNKKPMFFGAAHTGNAYVSFHLMPVYAFPELLEGISPELKKRKQGKSCFKSTAADQKLFKELAKLTKPALLVTKQRSSFRPRENSYVPNLRLSQVRCAGKLRQARFHEITRNDTNKISCWFVRFRGSFASAKTLLKIEKIANLLYGATQSLG